MKETIVSIFLFNSKKFLSLKRFIESEFYLNDITSTSTTDANKPPANRSIMKTNTTKRDVNVCNDQVNIINKEMTVSFQDLTKSKFLFNRYNNLSDCTELVFIFLKNTSLVREN